MARLGKVAKSLTRRRATQLRLHVIPQAIKEGLFPTEKDLMRIPYLPIILATLITANPAFSAPPWSPNELLEAADPQEEEKLTPAQIRARYLEVAKRMNPVQIGAFRYLDCAGEPFRLSEVEPIEEKRLILTGGKNFDLDFQGDSKRSICKDYKTVLKKEDLGELALDPKKALDGILEQLNRDLDCKIKDIQKQAMERLKKERERLVKEERKSKKKKGLFDDESLLEMEIHGPFSGGLKTQELETDGKIISISEGGKELKVKLSRRGHGRGSCPVPLLKVSWDKKDPSIQDTLFDPLKDNDMKWVSHCKPEWGQRVVMYEYLAQKWAEAAQIPHMKTRLVRVTYFDSSNNAKFSEGYGFFMEPIKDLEKRYDKTIISDKTKGYEIYFNYFAHKDMDPTRGLPMMILEALALNRDYWIDTRKNSMILVEKMKKEDLPKFKEQAIYWAPVPYDMAMKYSVAINHKAGDTQVFLDELVNVKEARTPHWSTGWSDGKLAKGDKDRWRKEFANHAKAFLTHKQEVIDQADKLPDQTILGPNLKSHAEDFFKALESLIVK